MAPDDRFQQPDRPVQNAQKMVTKLIMKSAMQERAKCRRDVASSFDILSSSTCGK